MNKGTFDLKPIIDFARKNPEVPHRTKDRNIYIPYRKIVKKILKEVPNKEPGWYCWFSSLQEVIYIGQASKRKTSSLYARLLEELLEEYVAFWIAVNKNAAKQLSEKYNRKYQANIDRAELKKNTRYIAWVSNQTISDGVLDIVEQKLINDLNPSANKDQKDYSEVDTEIYKEVKQFFVEELNKSEEE